MKLISNNKMMGILAVCFIASSPNVAFSQAKSNKYPSFLSVKDLPDGVKYLPAPPDTSSVAFFNDFSRYQWGKSIRNSKRGEQAIDDATQTAESLARQFSEAFGLEISQTATPQIFYLLSLINSDCGYATQTAKHHYMRKRPFVQFHETTSIPAKEPHYRNTGSYPSGHSATGWGIALVLSEINPARQEEILKRGYEIGESRVIAGFHYQSDVDNARLTGSAAVARLHADKSFMKQLQKAKDEFTRLSK